MTISTVLADFWHQHYNLRQNFKNKRQITLIYLHFHVHTNQEKVFCLLFSCFASKIVQISTFRDKSRKFDVFHEQKYGFDPKQLHSIFHDPKRTKKNKRFWCILFLSIFSAAYVKFTKKLRKNRRI